MAKEYTQSQLRVINVNSGYNMVLAGPGCGKTDILAERIAKAYENGNVALEDILCLTFTNRAARGMYDRIKKRLGSDAEDLFVGNIHRYCSHFLFDNDVVSAETSVLDEDDANEIIQSEIPDRDVKDLIELQAVSYSYMPLYSVNWHIVNDLLGIEYPSSASGNIQEPKANKIVQQVKAKAMQMQHIIAQINHSHPRTDLLYPSLLETPEMKCSFPFYDDFIDACKNAHYDTNTFSGKKPAYQFLDLASKYGEYKANNCLLDFDDLLITTYDAYRADLDKHYKRFPWVQVDEIQDLSRFQISLVDLFTDTASDFVVLYLGDEQQAIYSFMGASLSTLNMLKSRCLNNIYRLDKNFRSPKYLLDIYNEYAVKELGVDKDFLPEPKDDQIAGRYDVCMHLYNSLDEEVNRIYDAVLPFLHKEGQNSERTALLVPWNIDANEISDRLKNDNISHFKISGTDTFQTVHMRMLMAHFNAVSNDFNMLAWSRILKQTYAVDSYSEGRHLIARMRNIAMSPSDLLREDGSTYLAEFCQRYDEEEIVLFDTETTGVDVFNDDIVQIAAIKLRKGKIVPGSQFNIFLYTQKEIPARLGRIENPMLKEYAKAQKYPRAEGLRLFMGYIGQLTLMGHNVQFDYNILKNNLNRDCKDEYASFSAITLDTLHIAHLLYPRLRKYKLAYLLERLDLQGENSHMADDDIMATFELANHSRIQSENYLLQQHQFLLSSEAVQAKDELSFSYKDCYKHSKDSLYILRPSGCALVDELKYADEYLTRTCEIRRIDRFDIVVDFLQIDVISKDEPNALYSHLSNHLMDMSTYREADLCDSSSFKEKLFVSTVHKAKGLEFENVIVLRSVEGRYPHFAHRTYDQQEEDKRLFYVAISRAMKRLVISGVDGIKDNFTPYVNKINRNFLVRFELYKSDSTYVLAEVSDDSVVIKYKHNETTSVQEFGPLFSYYANNNTDNLQLGFRIKSYCSGPGATDKVESLMRSYGIARRR